MNTYELTVVYSPKLSDIKLKKQLKAVESLVDKHGGRLVKADHWGKKALAYLIGKHMEAVYANWQIDLPPQGPNQVLKQLAVEEAVLRCLLVKTNKEKSTTSTTSATSTKGTKSMQGKKEMKTKRTEKVVRKVSKSSKK